MPPAVIAVIADAIYASASAIGVSISLTAAITAAQVVVGIGVSLALGFASLALQKKPPNSSSVLQNSQGRLVTVRQPASPRRVITGALRCGGVLTYIQGLGSANNYLLLVLTLAGHELDSIDKVYMDGNELVLDGSGNPTDPTFATNLHFEFNMGFSGQTVFPSLVYDSGGAVTTAFRQRGNAGVYIRLLFDQALFPKGLPNFTFDVTGKMMLDPRTDSVKTVAGATNATPIVITCASHGYATDDRVRVRDVVGTDSRNQMGADGVWEITVTDGSHFSLNGSAASGAYTSGGKCYRVGYSQNSALIIADFLTDPKYGFKARYDEDIDLARLTAAANVCDESVQITSGPDTYEPRYTADGMFDTTDKRGQVLQQLQGSMVGWVLPIAGKWVMIPGAHRTSVIELVDDDFIAPLKIRTRQSRRDLFNGVKGTFMSPDHGWQSTDFPAVRDATYVTEDGGIEHWKDVSLPFTTSQYRCQRLAAIDLYRQRRQMEIQAIVKMRGYKCQPGDVIEVTHARLSMAQKEFEVLQTQLVAQQDQSGNKALGIALHLRETDVDVYGFSVGDYGEIVVPTVPDLPTFFSGSTIPDPWQPFYELPIGNDGFLGNADYGFAVGILYVAQASGDIVPMLQLRGFAPMNQPSPGTPAVPFVGTVAVSGTGGHLAPGTYYFRIVSHLDAYGWSLPSALYQATIPAGPSTGKITLTGLTWPASNDEWMLFISTDQNKLASQVIAGTATNAEVVYSPNTVPGGLAPTSIDIVGNTALHPTSLYTSRSGPPDLNASHLEIKVKKVVHGGIAGTAVLSADATHIEVDQLGGTWVGNEFAGRYLTVFGVPTTDNDIADFVPRANLLIASNDTAGNFTFAAGQPNPTLGYDSMSYPNVPIGAIVGIQWKITSFDDTPGAMYIEDTLAQNPFYPAGLTAGAEAGNIIRFTSGAAKGNIVRILDNTDIRFTVEEMPDGVAVGDAFIVESQAFDAIGQGSPVGTASWLTLTTWELPVLNEAGTLLLVQVYVDNENGQWSNDVKSPWRMIWVYGKGSSGAAPSTFVIPFADPLVITLSDGAVQTVTLTADIAESSIVGTPVLGQTLLLYIFQDDVGGHTFSWPPNIVGGIQSDLGLGPNQRTKAMLQWDGDAWEFVYAPAIV